MAAGAGSGVAKTFAAKAVYDGLRQYAQTRPDIGAGKAILDLVLESRNPFQLKTVRAPKRWFVLLALLSGLGLACFVYFNTGG